MNEPSEAPETVTRLAAAAESTHRTIAALATAQVALTVARASDGPPKRVSDAATAFRNMEAELQKNVADEIAAHIAHMNYELEQAAKEG